MTLREGGGGGASEGGTSGRGGFGRGAQRSPPFDHVEPRRVGPKPRKSGARRGPKGGCRRVGAPKKVFSLSRHKIRSLWGSSRGIMVVFEAPGAQVCTFGVVRQGLQFLLSRCQKVGSRCSVDQSRAQRSGQRSPWTLLICVSSHKYVHMCVKRCLPQTQMRFCVCHQMRLHVCHQMHVCHR